VSSLLFKGSKAPKPKRQIKENQLPLASLRVNISTQYANKRKAMELLHLQLLKQKLSGKKKTMNFSAPTNMQSPPERVWFQIKVGVLFN
jgi:hypothetical protein